MDLPDVPVEILFSFIIWKEYDIFYLKETLRNGHWPMTTGEGCYKWRGDVNAVKFGLNKFGILMMGSNFREFVARWVSAEDRTHVWEGVNKMFVELLRYT